MEHSNAGKWVYSTSDEIFRTNDYSDTKEQAIEAGKVDLTWEGECPTFYVGQIENVDFALYVDPDGVLENIAQSVYDEVGEVAEDYLRHVDEEHFKTLEEDLNNVLRQWMDKFGYNPNFFKVTNIEKITA
ncbi:hypothetical protein P4V41_07855 [Fictibacillus nanhaiensis]|uniref:hypothetical protein n=1 Tax=Fictibacillus nanhaiensis TaxID=742169 RepID=UPI002E1F71F7|nr:hypothetical protein [Fictibacillus nanhaiensis]